MSDFDDDEDFGLGASGPPPAAVEPEAAPAEAQQPVPQPELPLIDSGDELDDIYGDIAEAPPPQAPKHAQPAAVQQPPQRAAAASAASAPQSAAGPGVGAEAERQASGRMAESRGGPSTALVPAGQPPVAGQQGRPASQRLADTTVVYVGELHWWTSDADLERECAEFGPVSRISFFEDRGSGKSKGYATVQFGGREAANACRRQLNGRAINGRKCVVTFSSSSTAAAVAAKAGGRPDAKQPSASGGGGGGGGWGRGQGSQAMQGGGLGPGAGMAGSWGGMPPMPHWGGMPLMGMGMGGLPMPGMGMPFMGMGMGGGVGGQPPPGQPNAKRKRH